MVISEDISSGGHVGQGYGVVLLHGNCPHPAGFLNFVHPVSARLQIHELVDAFPARLRAGGDGLQEVTTGVFELNLPAEN